jgi:glutathione S-transferase
MLGRTRIIGSFLSPYVRKVLVVLELKGLPYEVDSLTPFYGNDEFTRLSPLRRIPVLIDDRVTLCDSTVICEYLEERHPAPPLLPRSAEQRSRARWLEEYADTRMGDVCIWHFFYQLIVRRAVWSEAPDESIVRRAREVEIPEVLDYLERQLPEEGLLFESLSVADIAIVSMLRNAAIARYVIDVARWPRTHGFYERVSAMPPFSRLKRFEDQLIGVPIAERRARLLAAGAPLAPTTLADPLPRASIMLSRHP